MPLHIVRPSALAPVGSLSSGPVTVTVQAPALFQLLEFSQRSQEGSRVIGTLLGSRSDDGSEIEVKEAYIVPHREESDEVTIEEYHHRAQYQLYKRSNPKDTILGWFSTKSEIDSLTALLHDFYSRSSDGTHPHPAIHLTLNLENSETGEINSVPTINTYIGSPIGANGAIAAKWNIDKGSSYFFVPTPNKINFDVQDVAVLNFASRQVYEETSNVELPQGSVDLNSLVDHLNKIESLIDSTVKYIERIEAGEVKGDEKFGKFLLSNLKNNINQINLEDLERSFNSHIQDTLMIEYLASSIKTQLELSAKLTTLI
jgi:translation initiation factor 3 subunit F